MLQIRQRIQSLSMRAATCYSACAKLPKSSAALSAGNCRPCLPRSGSEVNTPLCNFGLLFGRTVAFENGDWDAAEPQPLDALQAERG